MHTINKYSQTFLNEFYIDANGDIRRSSDGYHGRFKKDDLATFFVGAQGYLFIQVPKQRTTVRRSHLALLLSGIHVPDHMDVDHIDGDRTNDHPSNLRVVDRTTNSKNHKKRTDNSSGVTGIMWSEGKQKFVIRRTVNGVRLSTSRKTMEEALQVLEDFTNQDGSYTDRHGI